MELDTKREIEKLQAEIEQLQKQLNQVEQTRNNLTTMIVKKMGALEMLQGLKSEPKKGE